MKKVILFFVLFFISLLWLTNCKNQGSPELVDENNREGYQLAQKYCKSCHQYPDPDLLNKTTWENYVLPKMGDFVGFLYLGMNHYVQNGNAETMKLDEWYKIVKYYTTESVQENKKKIEKTIKKDLRLFNVGIPSFSVDRPFTTMVNTISSSNGFFFADGLEQQLYFLSADNVLVDSFPILKGVSNLRIRDSAYELLSMGVLQPSDSREGKWVTVGRFNKNMRIIIDSLQRPVHISYADLNRDGLEDLVVCEFGNQTGMLSWFENSDKTQYKKHILRPLPGAIKTVVYDFNKDGLPDIMAMMAQGDEGMFIYYNLGNNNFNEERVLQFPPSYGSNYFDLLDINKDGYPDIVATNGDNGDYPPVLKAYHGIRIYLNNEKNEFSEKLFLAMNGVGKAIAMDFDKDGDIDLASISFFPDYNSTPEEGFIYWENTGGLTYEPSSFSQVTAGRWLTMDAGDIDGDKDIDIVLGNAFIVIGNVPDSLKKKWEAYRPSVIILRNNLNDISAP